MYRKEAVVITTNNCTHITDDERVALKVDLLNFVHSVTCGELSEPEHIKALIPVLAIIDKFFG